MRLSQNTLVTFSSQSTQDETVSAKLLQQAGMVQQVGSGLYNWLPTGTRVLDKITAIVSDEMDQAGVMKVVMPTMQPVDLWQASGRYDAYGDEMLRATDQKGRQLIYSPTAEEAATGLFKHIIQSVKSLPAAIFQTQWKFRDEIRPRGGVMRSREFLMKDAYSFDESAEAAQGTYQRMYVAYLRTFKRLGIDVIPMQADTGPVGGRLSHEFLLVADAADTQILYDPRVQHMAVPMDEEIYANPARMQAFYNAHSALHVSEMSDDIALDHLPDNTPLSVAHGIEVGHIFNLGTRYSDPLNAILQMRDGVRRPVHMGCYGIGLTRLVGAIAEAYNDKDGLKWPENVAPFKMGLIQLPAKADDTAPELSERFYAAINRKDRSDVLFDDRSNAVSPGVKFKQMDLIGIPHQFTVGRDARDGKVEYKNRATGLKEIMPFDQAVLQARALFQPA